MNLDAVVALLARHDELMGRNPLVSSDALILTATEDSRKAGPGSLFIAAPGTHADGHNYAEAAVHSGAAAVIGTREGIQQIAGAPYIRARHARRAYGLIAHALVGDPSKSMTVIGVTGTNGKSSSVLMIQHVFRAHGWPTGCFGTLGYDVGNEILEAAHTTPFAGELAEAFAAARANGLTHVAMEVSSHALEQERVAGIEFRVAAFTNLTQDHLDYHNDMDSYRRAKLRLFEGLSGSGAFTVVNLDDPNGAVFAVAAKVPCVTYGERGDCRASGIHFANGRSFFIAHTLWGTVPIEMALFGLHNIANALGVIAIAGQLGVPMTVIQGALATMPVVPGRFEAIHEGQSFHVIVDYAHTDDGLRNVLLAAREVTKKRVIVVFGCGGDRDKTKRPKMAVVAASMSDFAIVTSDNPRTEDPARILLDIQVGMQRSGKQINTDYLMLLDRREAIAKAISMARKDDLVLIAGKGHEDYQIVGTEKHHFDDREEARLAIQRRG